MTEREKMLAGELYDGGDPELMARWHRAKDLVRDYNSADSADLERKEAILAELLGGRGRACGLLHRFMWTTATTSFSETGAK